MKRVVVVGSSGSGKTTIARALSDKLALPHLEMDSVAHRGGFSDHPQPWFRPEIEAFAAGEEWVIDGNYTSWGTQEVVWPRADTFVWPDISKARAISRVSRRTLKRVFTREELWDGVKEPWSNLYSLDPYKNLMVWTWTRYDGVVQKYENAMSDGSWEHATVHRLRTPAQVRSFLSGVG